MKGIETVFANQGLEADLLLCSLLRDEMKGIETKTVKAGPNNGPSDVPCSEMR